MGKFVEHNQIESFIEDEYEFENTEFAYLTKRLQV